MMQSSPLNPSIFVANRWRDRWPWDRLYFFLLLFVPLVSISALILVLSVGLGRTDSHLWRYCLLGLIGFPIAVLYAMIRMRLGRHMDRISGGFVEATECLIARNHFRSPGIAVLYPERLELVRVIGGSIVIPLDAIVFVGQIGWFNHSKLLLSKRGLEIRVADDTTIQIAVPESVGVRWQGMLEAARKAHLRP